MGAFVLLAAAIAMTWAMLDLTSLGPLVAICLLVFAVIAQAARTRS